MISPVKDSDLAKQIERARQRIERWPQWLKDAAGIGGAASAESADAQKNLKCWPKLSTADFLD